MPSSTIRSIEMAHEPTFCNLGQSANGAPVITGLTFTPIEVIDSSGLIVSDEPLQDSGDGNRAGFYTTAPSAVVDPNGNPIVRGSLTLDFYLRSMRGVYQRIDTSYSSYKPAVTVRELLGTRLKAVCAVDGAVANEDYESLSGDKLSLLMGDRAVVYSGQMLAAMPELSIGHDNLPSPPDEPAPVRRYSMAERIEPEAGQTTAHDLFVTPYTEGDNDKVMSPLEGFYQPTIGGDPVRQGNTEGGPWSTTSQPTVCLRITGDGWQQVCYGCALTALTITSDGDSRAVKCSATVDVAYAVTSYGTFTPVYPTTEDGPVLHSLGMAASFSEPFALPSTGTHKEDADASGVCVDSWTLSLSWATAAASCGSYWVGRAPLEATNLETTLEMSLSGTSALSTMLSQWKDGTYRTVVLGFGGRQRANMTPPSIDNDLSSFGGCICLPAACLMSGAPTPDTGSDILRTTITLGAGPYMDTHETKKWAAGTLSAGGFSPSVSISYMPTIDWDLD